jgi:YggT family protein
VENPLLEYWYVHLPNYLLAALMYTLLGRFVLGLFVSAGSSGYVWRVFVRLTDPVLAAVRPITPAAVPQPVLLVFAAIWMLLLRVALIVAFASAIGSG